MQPIIKGRRPDEELCKSLQKINRKEFSLDCSQGHIQPRPIYLGIMVLPTVSWVFLNQLSILEIGPIYIPTNQYEETIIQLRFHLLEMSCVSSFQKTNNLTSTMPLTYGHLRTQPNHTRHSNLTYPTTWTEDAPLCACPPPPGILGTTVPPLRCHH